VEAWGLDVSYAYEARLFPGFPGSERCAALFAPRTSKLLLNKGSYRLGNGAGDSGTDHSDHPPENLHSNAHGGYLES
jgi:hypothetical protein